jgi:hypothetical protein
MLSEEYELRTLEAHLGEPEFRQTAKRGEGKCRLVHWGCGCTAIGDSVQREAERMLMRWTRCDHHVLSETAALA